ncbi:sensor histidine kinase [Clostridium formicaceticum]|uniref:histidine kinase n=1 Tax=Clostridium formicaceticum TaxID=1497 RepID=A0AAC9RGL6_9CLOT|nr:HAMP domain-containing sensor histidine kinase [Clostridium formicaceticum]AOY76141.1 two-component sensor histidine kinase [Clostridium formicaceticum]ARE86509.1 Sensor histidine kinase CssS [Clostridium formicaceticum]
MKNLPLSLQIWLVFAAIMLAISILLTGLFPWTLRDFFTREIYATIESGQNLILNRFHNESPEEAWEDNLLPRERHALQDIRTVNHFIILSETQEIIAQRLPIEFLNKVRLEASQQVEDSQRYSGQVDDRKVFYVINKGEMRGHEFFLVSYMWDAYREDLVQTLFRRLLLIMSLVFLLSWIPSLLLARYLSNPLVALEKRVKKLTNRDWNETIQLQRKDEIGKLGESIEQLRTQLVRQDEAQQSFLQHTSHELKTPVMIIRSYVQAIGDGIYPKGDLTNSLQVIEEEAERLEKRIYSLLYLTKLDYLATHKPFWETVNMHNLIIDVVERFRWNQRQLDWSLDLSDIEIKGDIEQWCVVLENLLDNQIRYAQHQILISLKKSEESTEKTALLRIWNDGPNIEEETIDILFNKFRKGSKGEFGLGLAISHRIVSLHGGRIWVKNEEEGVSFYLAFPFV